MEFCEGQCNISIFGNALTLNSITVPDADRITSVKGDGEYVGFSGINGRIVLDNVEIHKELNLR